MHAMQIVTRVLGPCLYRLHAKRAAALKRATLGLLFAGVASLSAIALRLSGQTRLKHRLKSVDRLLGNSAAHLSREDLYREIARCWLDGLSQVLLVIDWSDLTANQRWQWLRASVVVDGRSVTLYEEVHPQSRLGNAKVHQRFVRRLAGILPPGCRPIVMTDAGFHATWFKLVQAQGWEFVGRIRGRDGVRVGSQGKWMAARDYFAQASLTAQDLGAGTYARSNRVAARFVLAKRPAKGREQRNLYGAKRASRSSLKNARSAREPWLLAYSAGLAHLQAQAVVTLYAQRMRIEESFRDTKNERMGLGLVATRSRSAQRLEMLLLIVHLAAFVQRLIGEQAKERQLALDFMSTRRSDRPEISIMTLGRRIIESVPELLDRLQPWQALSNLALQAARACFTVKQYAG